MLYKIPVKTLQVNIYSPYVLLAIFSWQDHIHESYSFKILSTAQYPAYQPTSDVLP